MDANATFIIFESPIFTDPIYGQTTMANILWFFVILIIAVIVAKIVSLNLTRFLKDRVRKNDLNLISKAAYWVIFAIGFLTALPYLEVDLSGILVAGGVVGIIIGFAAQSVVANLISGIFLIFEQPLKIGENVLIEDTHIIVEDIRIFSTIGKTFEGIYVRIPNEKIFTTTIINYVANTARRFEYDVEIRYQDDASRAIEIIKALIEEEPFCLKNPGPSIYVDELASDGVIIKTRMWAPSEVWWDIRTTMLWKIKSALEADGMEIPFPQRTIWINPEERDEFPSKILPDAQDSGENHKQTHICCKSAILPNNRESSHYSTTPYNGPDEQEK
ncbi:mechanosensitive ion channel family protein [Methanogenium organophilum]|uniref:Mechanosensitive ion channel family protein n=1 Tax=Methanogenium organophilum TaxID=2199 RepID=A0A9X9S4X3_METOG|nr:mechanosensitive ion channel family protein [Methanogenium organophilum]WAI01596.1 mechanosensitive ion channel family protein [Methanogenium organophilum]